MTNKTKSTALKYSTAINIGDYVSRIVNTYNMYNYNNNCLRQSHG